MTKKRVVKDFDALPEEIIRQVKLEYPTGFADNLLYYTNAEGKKVSALPFETEEVYYLIRMTVQEAKRLVREDDDYDDDGVLREDFADLEVEDDDEFDGVGEDDEDMPVGSEEDDHIIVTRRKDDDDDVNDIPDDPDF
ncbi:MAG: hypothetical protein R3D58_13420 [Saprospiraceae bacterium]|nr:hypothetical protein [Lewinellaceae bacterium]